MFLQEFPNLCAPGDSMEVKLPRKGLILDPTVNSNRWYVRFDIRYPDNDAHDDNGNDNDAAVDTTSTTAATATDTGSITVTLTRLLDTNHSRHATIHINDATSTTSPTSTTTIHNELIGYPFTMRVFDPEKEDVPDFLNTKLYVYFGVDGEHPPHHHVTEVVIHPSVKIIKSWAFQGCRKMRRCTIHGDQVVSIESHAFENCVSLDAMFLPSSLKRIGTEVFRNCFNLRILSIPIHILSEQIGYKIIRRCSEFFRSTNNAAILPCDEYSYSYLNNNTSSTNNINMNVHVNMNMNRGGHSHSHHHEDDSGGSRGDSTRTHTHSNEHDQEWCFGSTFILGVFQNFAKRHHENNGYLNFYGHLRHHSVFASIRTTSTSTSTNTSNRDRDRDTRAREEDERRYHENLHQAVIHLHHNLPPLHKVCLDRNVTAQAVHECLVTHGTEATSDRAYSNHMTPMQILALNPHATTGSIMKLLHANMSAVFEKYMCISYTGGTNTNTGIGTGTGLSPNTNAYGDGKTPLDYLMEHDVDSFVSVMVSLCSSRY